MRCNRCQGSGFLNLHQITDELDMGPSAVFAWMASHSIHDVQVCDCCGDGTNWYGEPGEHYGPDDPRGPNGPYASNGGLASCN